MKKEIKESIIITTYWHEDEDGYAIIDHELMEEEFYRKMKKLDLSTKKGYRKAVDKLIKSKNENTKLL